VANRENAHRLVLWDIDHTLIETRGVGKRLYVAAFEEATGHRMEHAVEPTGRTEQAIFVETLERHGIATSDELQQRYVTQLADQYAQHADLLRAEGRGLPGARAAVAALADQTGVVQTVLTGNIRAVAITKLRVFGLDVHIDFEVGAYGEDASRRAKLVAVAQRRAADKYSVRFDQENTVIVGDTVQDVIAAHQGGASIVGVASGRDSADNLREAGAEVVLPDLTDTQQVIAAVYGS
jgi:phosphoglycolate phosphatase